MQAYKAQQIGFSDAQELAMTILMIAKTTNACLRNQDLSIQKSTFMRARVSLNHAIIEFTRLKTCLFALSRIFIPGRCGLSSGRKAAGVDAAISGSSLCALDSGSI